MWIWIIIAGVIGFFIYIKMRAKGKKFGAAMNALMAKYTISKLDQDSKKEVMRVTVDELSKGGFRDPNGTLKSMKEPEFYGFCAMGMAQLNIEPFVESEKWTYIPNPFVALINAEKYINFAQEYLKKNYDIDVSLDKH